MTNQLGEIRMDIFKFICISSVEMNIHHGPAANDAVISVVCGCLMGN